MKYICRDCGHILKKGDNKNKCPKCKCIYILIDGDKDIYSRKEKNVEEKTTLITVIISSIVLVMCSKYFIETGLIFIDSETTMTGRHFHRTMVSGAGAAVMGYIFIGAGIAIGVLLVSIIKRYLFKKNI